MYLAALDGQTDTKDVGNMGVGDFWRVMRFCVPGRVVFLQFRGVIM